MTTPDPATFAWPFIATDTEGAARATGLSRSEIERAVQNSELFPSYRGRKPLFLATELHAWVSSMPNQPYKRSA